MSTRNIFWGKGGRCLGLTTKPPSCADCLGNLGASTSWNPQGLSRPGMGLLYYQRRTQLQVSTTKWLSSGNETYKTEITVES